MLKKGKTIKTIPPVSIKPNEGGAIDFPDKNDVLNGRGGKVSGHSGNVHFRKLVDEEKVVYLCTRRKKDKAVIAAALVNKIRAMDPPGRFLEEDVMTGMWHEIGDERARRKTKQALREDGSEIIGEMGEDDMSKTTRLMLMSGYPPSVVSSVVYPPIQPMYYPPLMYSHYPYYPTPLTTPFTFPPYPYPPPPVVTPATPVSPQTPSNEAKPASKTSLKSPPTDATKEKTATSKVEVQDTIHIESFKPNKFKKSDKIALLKCKKTNIDSNNSSQTDITANSSTLCDDTEMDVEFYEYKPDKIQAKENEKSSKRSRRSQWRETIKRQSEIKEVIVIDDDFPTVIVSNSEDMEEEGRIKKKYLKCSDSSNSLPEPSFTTTEDSSVTTPPRSFSMTDFDVIETLVSMSNSNRFKV